MIQIITDTSEIDLYKLEKFVYHHPHANFFQSTKAYQFFQSVDNYDPNLIVALDGEKIVGSLLAIVIKENTGLKRYFSRRCIVWGGPLAKEDNPYIWARLVNKLASLTSKKAIYTEFRNFRDLSNQKKMFKDAGYKFDEHLNYIVPVPSFDHAKSGLSKSKKRQINKSLRSGAEITPAESIEQVKSFYGILDKLYEKKVKKPLPHFRFFSRFLKDKSLGKYLLVKYEGQIIGGIMCPVYKDTIYEWFVCGMDRELEEIYPSVLATWAPIEYAANNGLKYFDFMGAGKPHQDYGVREFKSKFGGDLVNYGRYLRVNQKLYYQIGKIGLEILKRFN